MTIEHVLHEILLRFEFSQLDNDLFGLFNASHRSATKLNEYCDSIPKRTVFLKTRAQCRCDSSGMRANNLGWRARTVLIERQPDTIQK